MQYNPAIFKAYDIRGVYGRDFDESFAFAFGGRFLSLLAGKTIVIARDGRLSSKGLYDAVVRGAMAAGARVIGIGLSTTPLFYYSVRKLGADGGMIVTASHNDREYNGFKVTKAEAVVLEGKLLKEAFGEGELVSAEGGSFEMHDVATSYRNDILRFADLPRTIRSRVVVDCGNGAAGIIAKQVLDRLILDYAPLFFDIDGSFPNHRPNPLLIESQIQAKATIAATKADFGVLFDGDADRIVFLDSAGEPIPSDFVLLLLAQQFKRPIIVHDLKMSRIVPEIALAWGGRAIKSRTGHTFIKQLMRAEQAHIGGELSGHFPMSEMGNNEACILLFLKVLNLVERSGKSLEELVAPFRKYHHSGEINFEVHDIPAVLKSVERRYSDGKLSYLDGITVDYPNWWFNVRGSNTEPLLRLVVETDTVQSTAEKVAQLTNLIEGRL